MEVSMNTNVQNPNFGYFNFSTEATKYCEKKLKPSQIARFKEIVDKERANTTIKADIDCHDKKLNAYLRKFKTDGSVDSDYSRDLGKKGVFQSILGFLASVSKQSTLMVQRYNNAQKVASVISGSKN